MLQAKDANEHWAILEEYLGSLARLLQAVYLGTCQVAIELRWGG